MRLYDDSCISSLQAGKHIRRLIDDTGITFSLQKFAGTGAKVFMMRLDKDGVDFKPLLGIDDIIANDWEVV